MSLLNQYDVEIGRPACDYSSEEVVLYARRINDITPIFPYLNAILPDAEYHAQANALRFTFEGHVVTMNRDEVFIWGLDDNNDAIETLGRLRELIDDIWEQRETIVPSYAVRTRLTLMEVYRRLPRTNCRRCGFPTCFAFASQVLVGQADLSACPAASGNAA